MTESRTRVLLLGTHGQHNIGDELLLEAFLAGLGHDIEYVVNSYDVPFTTAQLAGRYRATVFDTSAQRFSIWRWLGEVDAVVFAGGSIVKGLYRSVGRFRLATLLMLLAIVVAARLRGVPVAMLNIGVGPLPTWWGRRVARAVLRRVTLLTVRDAASARTCAELGIPARESADVVFASAAELGLQPADPRTPASDAPLRIALNLNFHIANADNWEHFQEVLARVVNEIGRTRAIELHALPMQSEGKDHDDAAELREFAHRLAGVQIVGHSPRDHDDVARIISSCDLVVAERFHALVIAALLGVPFYALVYDVKVASLVEALDASAWAVDINDRLDADRMTAALMELMDSRSAVGAQLGRAAEELSLRARPDLMRARAWVTAKGDTR